MQYPHPPVVRTESPAQTGAPSGRALRRLARTAVHAGFYMGTAAIALGVNYAGLDIAAAMMDQAKASGNAAQAAPQVGSLLFEALASAAQEGAARFHHDIGRAINGIAAIVQDPDMISRHWTTWRRMFLSDPRAASDAVLRVLDPENKTILGRFGGTAALAFGAVLVGAGMVAGGRKLLRAAERAQDYLREISDWTQRLCTRLFGQPDCLGASREKTPSEALAVSLRKSLVSAGMTRREADRIVTATDNLLADIQVEVGQLASRMIKEERDDLVALKKELKTMIRTVKEQDGDPVPVFRSVRPAMRRALQERAVEKGFPPPHFDDAAADYASLEIEAPEPDETEDPSPCF